MGININKQFITQTLDYQDDMYLDARKLRDKAAKRLREEGYVVKVETITFTDLDRFKMYRLTACKYTEVF